MSVLKPTSIRSKLMLFIMGVTVASLVVVGTILIFIDKSAAIQSMEERLSMESRIIADRSTAALTYEDAISATKSLSVLKEDVSVVLACTFTKSDELFASYTTISNIKCPKNRISTVENQGVLALLGEHSYITQQVVLNGDTKGQVLIVANHLEIRSRLIWFVEVIGFLIVLAIIVSYFLANKLQSYITEPLNKLTSAAEHVTEYNDYSRKLTAVGNDEIGVLYQSFNRMLSIIQLRESEQQETEITLRRSEERFRTLVQNAPFCIYELDIDGRFISMNICGINMMGYKRESEALENNFIDMVEQSDKERVTQILSQTFLGKGASFEFEAIDYTGQLSYFSSNFVPLNNSQGEDVRIMGITSNITEQKKAELSLRRSQKMDAVGQLTGGIAHDFNNILGIMSGNLELLEMNVGENEKALKRIRNIKKSSDRAAKLTRQLLGFSRSHAVHVKNTNLNQIIEQLLELIARSITPQIEVVRILEKILMITFLSIS